METNQGQKEINGNHRAQNRKIRAGGNRRGSGSVIKSATVLPNYKAPGKGQGRGELLDFRHESAGRANLKRRQVGVVLFGDFQKIQEGDVVKRTGRVMQVPVGQAWSVAWSMPWESGRRARTISPRDYNAVSVWLPGRESSDNRCATSVANGLKGY